jgi:hypothetical protein
LQKTPISGGASVAIGALLDYIEPCGTGHRKSLQLAAIQRFGSTL